MNIVIGSISLWYECICSVELRSGDWFDYKKPSAIFLWRGLLLFWQCLLCHCLAAWGSCFKLDEFYRETVTFEKCIFVTKILVCLQRLKCGHQTYYITYYYKSTVIHINRFWGGIHCCMLLSHWNWSIGTLLILYLIRYRLKSLYWWPDYRTTSPAYRGDAFHTDVLNNICAHFEAYLYCVSSQLLHGRCHCYHPLTGPYTPGQK